MALGLRPSAFDFPFSVPRSRIGGYDERKLEQTSKPANPRRQTALYENPRRQTAFYENTRRQMVFPTLTLSGILHDFVLRYLDLRIKSNTTLFCARSFNCLQPKQQKPCVSINAICILVVSSPRLVNLLTGTVSKS